ncbi:MAG TPA: hypothetical protein PLF01_08275, partial [Alphaproteobacteria bacterium]|nr:hypothetical protein [Alphaproteobacteria bacterium]
AGLFCAGPRGQSCPDLRMEAYRAEDIEEQLDDQVKKLLQNKTKGFDLVKGEINTVRVNEIFKWEEKEFNKGNVKSWLLRYFPLVINAATKIKYYDFDWSLNSQPRD